MPEFPPYHPPVLPVQRYVVWKGCGFMDRAYENATGAVHTGIDLNLASGGDSDLGQPVYAVTRGKVLVARSFPVWGNVVLVECPGPAVWLQYAHLASVAVREGQRVEAGARLGSIGKGDRNRYPAHLHFEVRLRGPSLIPPDYWPSAELDRATALGFVKTHYAEPLRWLRKVGAVPWLWASRQLLNAQPIPVPA